MPFATSIGLSICGRKRSVRMGRIHQSREYLPFLPSAQPSFPSFLFSFPPHISSLSCDGQYLLMGAAGSYSNFHIDFGGSSVWYNVIKGKKIFLLSPPTDHNLDAFHQWYHLSPLSSSLPPLTLGYLKPLSESLFFPLFTKETAMVEVNEGESIVIPGGWAHVQPFAFPHPISPSHQ